MDTDRIKKIKESKRKAAQRKYDNFQASGDYYDPQSVKNFLDQVLLIGRQYGCEKEQRGSFR